MNTNPNAFGNPNSDETARTAPVRQFNLLALAVVALSILAISQTFFSRGRLAVGPIEPRVVTPRGDLAADEKATIELFREASQSVAHITTSEVGRNFRSNSMTEVPKGTGSGFLWDNHGHVVTNFHVIEGADRCRVTLADQSVWNGTVIGAAPDRDIAVLKIDAPVEVLKPIVVGTSSDLLVGQKVFAIGTPFGLDQTLTTGVISGLGREIQSRTGRRIEGVIQTDASINPGNSGGPLIDSAGRVIGVNTAIFSPSGASVGIGFAIPIDSVNRTVTRLIRDGRIVRPGLNINVAPDTVTQKLGLKGVLILAVLNGGAADQAGLHPTTEDDHGIHLGDILTAMNGKPLRSGDDLLAALEEHEAGDVVKFKILRNAKTKQQEELEVAVKLQALSQ